MDHFIFFLLLTLLIPIQLVCSDSNDGRFGDFKFDNDFGDKFKEQEKAHNESLEKMKEEIKEEHNDRFNTFIIVGCIGGGLFICLFATAFLCQYFRLRRAIHPAHPLPAFQPLPPDDPTSDAPQYTQIAQYPRGPLPEADTSPPQPQPKPI